MSGPSFEFATASRIVFGAGRAVDLPAIVRALGSRALLVTGRPRPGVAAIVAAVRADGRVAAEMVASGEPTVEDVRAGVAAGVAAGCDEVVAIGGGSVIDTGKAVAALVANGGDPLDYLEVVGAGRALTRASLPFVAVPTTAGSGAEVTRNAVLTASRERVKASLRSSTMLPCVALVDPQLTLDLPPDTTAATGLDALAQLIEPYLSRRANPLTDALCRDGVRLVAGWLRAAVRHGDSLPARDAMSLASLFGGLALANAGLGAVHGFAGPLGGRYRAPHGALCAALLPPVMRVNLAAARARSPEHPLVERMTEVARLLTSNRAAVPEDGAAWVEALAAEVGVPRLAAHGVTREDIPALVSQARDASSMRANAVDLTDAELTEILERAL